MAVYIYSLFQTVWYIILCNLFLSVLTENRKLQRWKWFLYQILAITCNYFISYFLDAYVVGKQILVILATSLFMFLIFASAYGRILIFILLYQAACIVVEYVTILFVQKMFGITWIMLTESYVLEPVVGLLCQMITLCLILILKKLFAHNNSETLTGADWLRFSVFPLFTIATILAMIKNFEEVQSRQQGFILSTIAGGMLLMNVLVFTLLNDVMKRESQIAQYRIFRERVKNEMEMYQSVSDNYEVQRRRAHEFQNHISCISALAREEEYEKLRAYLGELQKDVLDRMDVIDTNHPLVNAILNSKYQEAKAKGILFVMKTNDLSRLVLSDEDVVVLLSNLLNNAFEACEHCEERLVKLKFLQESEQTLLSVINSCNAEPEVHEGRYLTSKTQESYMHGVGIENIRDTVAKYGGDCVIRYEAPAFKVVIQIPNEGRILSEKG